MKNKAIDFPHDYIIRIYISSQPCKLLALRFLLLIEGHFIEWF